MNIAIEQAKLDAIAKYPNESGGFIVKTLGEDQYIAATNISDRGDRFRISREEFAHIHDTHDVIAFVHSHPNGKPEPSQADLVAIESTALSWLIISINLGVGGDAPSFGMKWFSPTGFVLPLTGRTFAHGVVDCYSLIRDYYSQVEKIQIPDFERFDDWWNTPANLYLDNFEKAGFVEVKDGAKNGDVLLLNIQTPPEKPCHAGIYLDHNIILHHLPNRLSSKDVYGGYYMRHTVKVLRYKTKC